MAEETGQLHRQLAEFGAERPLASHKNAARLWRAFDEMAESEEAPEFVRQEFPEGAAEWNDPFSRRHFLKLMGASLSLAGLCGCVREPEAKIVPYVVPPETMVPGIAQYFASTFTFCGFGRGVVVESHEGRPTKIEGNPKHPASRGAADIFMQASILDLYDPDRAQSVTRLGQVSTWGTFQAFLRQQIGKLKQEATAASGGAGGGFSKLRILTEGITSPTLHDQIQAVLKLYPGSQWHHYEPVNRDNVILGTRMAFGKSLHPVYRFERAVRILSLDSDFLFAQPGSLEYAHQFINGRRCVRGVDVSVVSGHSVPGAASPIQDSVAPKGRGIGCT